MNRFRSTLIAVLATLGVSVALAINAPAASAAAFVYHANGSFECGVGPGDVPDLPGLQVDLANTTVVVDAAGKLHVTCYGALPDGLSVPRTFVGLVMCPGEDSGFADTTGRIIVTGGGQVFLTCIFAAPSG